MHWWCYTLTYSTVLRCTNNLVWILHQVVHFKVDLKLQPFFYDCLMLGLEVPEPIACTCITNTSMTVPAVVRYMNEETVSLFTIYLFTSILFWSFGQVFLFHPPIRVCEGDDLVVSFAMTRSRENHRLMEVGLECQMKQSSGKLLSPIKKKYYIEWTREGNMYFRVNINPGTYVALLMILSNT